MKTSIKLLSLVLILILLVLWISPAARQPDGEPVSDKTHKKTSEHSVEIADLIALHNEARKRSRRCGSKRMPAAGELSWNGKLGDAAGKHAQDMVANNFVSHTGSDKSTFSERAKAASYQVSYLAENIGQGYADASAIFAKWLSSPAHCRNIMNANYQDIGAAKIEDYWVAMYGRE